MRITNKHADEISRDMGIFQRSEGTYGIRDLRDYYSVLADILGPAKIDDEMRKANMRGPAHAFRRAHPLFVLLINMQEWFRQSAEQGELNPTDFVNRVACLGKDCIDAKQLVNHEIAFEQLRAAVTLPQFYAAQHEIETAVSYFKLGARVEFIAAGPGPSPDLAVQRADGELFNIECKSTEATARQSAALERYIGMALRNASKQLDRNEPGMLRIKFCKAQSLEDGYVMMDMCERAARRTLQPGLSRNVTVLGLHLPCYVELRDGERIGRGYRVIQKSIRHPNPRNPFNAG